MVGRQLNQVKGIREQISASRDSIRETLVGSKFEILKHESKEAFKRAKGKKVTFPTFERFLKDITLFQPTISPNLGFSLKVNDGCQLLRDELLFGGKDCDKYCDVVHNRLHHIVSDEDAAAAAAAAAAR